MPNYTDNLGLIQPLGSEKIRIAQLNQNMDILDEAIGAVGDKSLQQQILDIGGGIAIMASNNTHPAITAEQFVFVRNHSTLADGAYTANSNIAENATLSSSNLTAVPGGGFNALKAGIASLSEQIGNMSGSPSGVTDVTSPISAYPLGFNTLYVGSDGNWPMAYATVTTFKCSATYGMQFIANYQGKLQFRATVDGAWSSAWTVISG